MSTIEGRETVFGYNYDEYLLVRRDNPEGASTLRDRPAEGILSILALPSKYLSLNLRVHTAAKETPSERRVS